MNETMFTRVSLIEKERQFYLKMKRAGKNNGGGKNKQIKKHMSNYIVGKKLPRPISEKCRLYFFLFRKTKRERGVSSRPTRQKNKRRGRKKQTIGSDKEL